MEPLTTVKEVEKYILKMVRITFFLLCWYRFCIGKLTWEAK